MWIRNDNAIPLRVTDGLVEREHLSARKKREKQCNVFQGR
jgi:hypothetical protein